jgi:hypothetical protein
LAPTRLSPSPWREISGCNTGVYSCRASTRRPIWSRLQRSNDSRMNARWKKLRNSGSKRKTDQRS